MGLNNNDNMFQNESIFQSAKDFEDNFLTSKSKNKPAQTNGLLANLVKTITNKLNELDDIREKKAITKTLEKIFSQEEDIIQILVEFGCKFSYINATTIELQWEKYNMKGYINLQGDSESTFDENAKKIVYQMVDIMLGSEKLEIAINRMEAEGFYPIGELEKKQAIIDNQECEVLVGTMQNAKGETKKIYFYNGKEVFPTE